MSANKIKKPPDYSSYAKKYAESRPGYPEELFKYLASLVKEHNLVWDCATGNGQAALSLTEYFKKVIATDISSEQIKNTTLHDRIEYKVCKADESGLENNSVDLVTVASAIHWFDLDKFYKEVKRVVKPGGVIAAWSYHVGYVNPPFDKLFKRFFLDVISPYFGTGAWLVDEQYSTINLPGSEIDSANFSVEVKWNLYKLLNFIESWSAAQEYKKEKGQNPVDLIIKELKQLWGEAEKINTLRWPLYLKISRL